MTPLVKVLSLIVGVAFVTTLILPGRQTPQVINAAGNLLQGTLGTAMGTRS